jgi:hypothetical protein
VRLSAIATNAGAILALSYISAVVVLRPWQRDWGSTTEERSTPLPGDAFAGDRERAGDRAIAIDVPADRVWPWLLQLGEDRGGFYSYAKLENLFGLHIVNAESIEPEWQSPRGG